MRCMLCGTDNRDGAVRCKSCGGSLEAAPKGPVGVQKTPAPTVLEGSPPASPSGEPKRKTAYVPPEKVLEPVPGGLAGGKRKTVYVPPEEAERQVGATAARPRVVGFLVTYTWDPGGEFFAFREGKNVVGSGEGCDFVVARDRAMSGQHFAVLVRGSVVRVRDLDSTNATKVDGQEIWGEAAEVRHGSVVKAGDTTFRVVLVPEQEVKP